jgi:hypothetical protein
MIKVLVSTLLLIFSLVFIPTIYAQDTSTDPLKDIPLESTNPGSPYYIFKRTKESFQLNFLTFGDHNKAKYIEKLLDIRLNELTYMVKNGQTGILENGAHRYTNQAGNIIEKYLKSNSDFKTQTQRHLPVLNRLRDYYPSNSPQWLMIQESVDTAKRISGS